MVGISLEKFFLIIIISLINSNKSKNHLILANFNSVILVTLSSTKFVWSVNSQKNRREKSECSIISTVQPPNILTELVRHF